MNPFAALRRFRAAWDIPGPVIIGYAFFVQNGAWKSIYNYYRHCDQTGKPARLIDRRNLRTFRQLVAAFCFSRTVIFNSLECFWYWEAILFCLLRRNTYVYLHDREHTLGAFAREHPFKHRLLARILRRNPVLCVSQGAADLYRERYGTTRSAVIYENIGARQIPDFPAGKVHIVMTGVIDPRKGVDLFSAVADRAAADGKPWQFHWLGGVAAKNAGRRSENVKWWGWVENVGDFLAQADVFFLASKDDPFPLACLEAIRARKRCIVYRATGISEILDGVRGCGVYEEHTTDAAYATLARALSEPSDPATLAEVERKFYDLDTFSARLDGILAEDRKKA